MSLTPEQYLSLSALAYEQLSNSDVGRPIKEVMQNIENINKPELRALSSLSSWVLVNAYTSPSGMSAIAIQNPETKEMVFAYRGTDINRGSVEMIKDFLTDLHIASSGNLMLKDGANQFQDAFNFYINTVKKVGGASNIGTRSFTGHSLGGGLAQYMAYMTNGAYKTMTFDAVGIGQILKDVNFSSYNNNVKNYVNENDFIGNYGDHLGEVIYIEDQAKVHKDAAIQKRNRDIDVAQQYALDAVMEAAKKGEVGKGAAWLTAAALAEIGQNMQNVTDNFTITNPHNPSSLLDGDGNMGSKVQHGNSTVVAAGKATQAGLNVQTVIIKGVHFFVVELPSAVADATIKVSVEIFNGAVRTFVETSEFIGERIYDIGTFIGYSLYDMGASFGYAISSMITSLTRQAGTIPIRIDPIVLDLSGQGITTKSVADGVYYDLDNNGFAEKTGWIDAKSGILVLDRDGNGKIEAGKELFGDRTILDDGKTASSGFAALATLDSNRDGIIDAKDVKFSELRIWVDKDGNGVSTPDELLTLEEAGIKSLNLSNELVGKVDENGNTIARIGSFTRTDGTTADMKEFFLQRDTTDVQMTNSVEIPEDIMNLPEIHPMGNTYSLRQAMARDTTGALKQLVQDFINTNDVSSRQAKLQDILFMWVGALQINPTSRGNSFDARKLAVLETVTGTSYRNSPTSLPTAVEAPILERSYTVLLESVYTMLSMQTNLAGVFRKFNYSLDLESEKPIKLDIASVQAYLDEQLQSDTATGEKMLAEVTRALRNRGIISDVEFAHLREHFAKKSVKYQRIIDTAPLTTMLGTDAGESISGVVDQDNVITAGDGNDTLIGAARNDLLYGDAGNDMIYGMRGDDVLIGGEGADQLYGREGNDTYIFSKGDGTDYIEETDGFDMIKFGEGILPEDVILQTVSGYGNKISLEITIKNTTDKIVVDGHFGTRIYNSDRLHADNPGNQIERIIFSNGVSWGIDEIHRRAHDMVGTNNADHLVSFEDGAYTYHGLGGNDSVIGGFANDSLYGDDGNDTIYGYGGNDVLSGGAGNDQLRGGAGDDVYLFSRGDGVDYIEETDGFDTIKFGEGISPNNVIARVVSTEGNSISLELSIAGTNDKMTIHRHFGQYSYYQAGDIASLGNQIERVMFADGTAWDLDEIYRRAHDMVGTDGNDNFSMVGNAPVIYHGLAGNDNISGRSGKDILYGDAGDDSISGGGTLIGGLGNDRIYGGKGDDVYIFNRGDGQDLITDTGGVDTIRFGDSICPDDIVIKRVGNGYGHNLELCIKDTDDKVAVYEHFGTNSYWGSVDNPAVKIERVEFADGTVWTKEDIDDRMHNRTGTDGADTIEAYGKRGVVYHGLGGDDWLRGAAGDDKLYGDDGNDTISGGEGNNLLVGGRGNDIINGFSGDDTYIFNRGDGSDTIKDYGGTDTIQFGEGISPSDIVLKRVSAGNDYNLEISIKNTEDKVTVVDYFGIYNVYGRIEATPKCMIEKIEFADGTIWTQQTIYEMMHNITGTDKDDTIRSYDDGSVEYHGLAGNDVLVGGRGNDKLYGDDGDDRLSGGEGNDLFVGGKGNDTIDSFRGDSTYVFNRGDGKDVVADYGGLDTLQFGEGIRPKDIILKRVYKNSGYNLEISIKDTDDVVTFASHFGSSNYSGWYATPDRMLDRIKFADGTVWTKDDIDYKMHHLTGTEENDRLVAYDKADVVYYGRGGNDTLFGSEGNDKLYGDDGDDAISGGEGNDLLVGGKGNDELSGSRGDDIYIFNKGDGSDVISECGGIDTIKFGEGITPDDVDVKRVYKSGGDYGYVLELSLKGTSDKISVKNYFGYYSYSGFHKPSPESLIEKVVFADGTVWTQDTINNKVHNITGTKDSETIQAFDDDAVTYYGLGGNDNLYGSKSNDKLYGGAGNDRISSGEGDDLIVGGAGDDYLDGYYGNDTYVFNKGDGSDTVYDAGGNDDKIMLDYNSQDIMFERLGNNLRLRMIGSADSITIDSWYKNSSNQYKIETFKSATGSTITHTQIENLIQAMSSFQKDTGMTWEQALTTQPSQVQAIVQEYWTVPGV